MLGGVIASSEMKISSRLLCLVFVLSVFVTAMLTFIFSSTSGVLVEKAYQYFSQSVVVCAITAFILFSRVRVSERMAKFFQWAGDRSFIIFFVHVIFLGKLAVSDFIQSISQTLPLPVTMLFCPLPLLLLVWLLPR
jgi:surface polysaccharide O-acyltransferase-like enzyme